MGKWKREGLVLHGEEKSEGGLSIKQRRDERGKRTWTFWKDSGAEKKLRKIREKREESSGDKTLRRGGLGQGSLIS